MDPPGPEAFFIESQTFFGHFLKGPRHRWQDRWPLLEGIPQLKFGPLLNFGDDSAETTDRALFDWTGRFD